MSQSRRTNREQWRQRIAQQQSGGQSVAAFCRDLGVSENSFYFWKRRLRDDVATGFVQVITSPAPIREARPAGLRRAPFGSEPQGPRQSSRIEVRLRGRRRLLVRRGFDHGLLIELIQTLEGLA
jgi:transposase-like protein